MSSFGQFFDRQMAIFRRVRFTSNTVYLLEWSQFIKEMYPQVCFNCRAPGHKMSDCPFLTEANQQGTCFKCGSTEHQSSTCNVRVPKGKSANLFFRLVNLYRFYILFESY